MDMPFIIHMYYVNNAGLADRAIAFIGIGYVPDVLSLNSRDEIIKLQARR
jgi:hypothetical protein